LLVSSSFELEADEPGAIDSELRLRGFFSPSSWVLEF